MEINLIPMKQSDIKILKEKIWNQNQKHCPILKKEISLDNAVLDHIHKKKSEEASPNKGTIRTALDMRANALAGKIENNFKRYFGADLEKQDISLPEFLRNMADYLENEPYYEYSNSGKTKNYYIHPNEVPKRKKVKISEWNRIKKYYFKVYPTRKKLPKKPIYITENIEQLLKNIEEYRKIGK